MKIPTNVETLLGNVAILMSQHNCKIILTGTTKNLNFGFSVSASLPLVKKQCDIDKMVKRLRASFNRAYTLKYIK